MLTTPLYAIHQKLEPRWAEFAGWKLPLMFAGIVHEHNNVRQHAGIFDVSHMGRLKVSGSAAAAMLDTLVTADIRRLQVGQGSYSLCCTQAGTIADDVIVYRLDDDEYCLVCNASNRHKLLDLWAGFLSDFKQAKLNDITEASAMVAVQGPEAWAIFRRVFALSPSDKPKRFGCLRVEFAGGHSAWLARSGYTGEDGGEIWCSAADAAALWQALTCAFGEHGAAEHGATPAGLGARDSLRLEAALPLYGHELDEQTHPFEAGLGFAVALDKSDFIGKTALIALHPKPLKRQLIGLRMLGRSAARQGYAVQTNDGEPIGTVTSGGPSPTLGHPIALAYVPSNHAQPGTELSIDIRGRSLPAVVVQTPFFRRSQHRST